MAASAKDTPGGSPAGYQINIVGEIRENWSDWLNGMQISTERDAGESHITTLVGVVVDQAALRGILCRVWDLNLTVLSVSRIETNAGEKAGRK